MAGDFGDAFEAGKSQGLVERAMVPFKDSDGNERIFVPDGLSMEDLAGPLNPVRKKGEITFNDVASFVRYLKRHETDHSTIVTASKKGLKATATFNDHEPGNNGKAGHGDFKAHLLLAATNDWNAWGMIDKRQKPQRELADFLEENLHTVVEPTGGELMAAIKTIQVQKSVTYKSVVNLDDGSIQFTYDDVVGGSQKRGEVVIPSRLTLALEPFEGAGKYEVKARLRYKLSDEGLFFTVTLDRPDKVRDAAFSDVLKSIEDTGHQPFLVA